MSAKFQIFLFILSVCWMITLGQGTAPLKCYLQHCKKGPSEWWCQNGKEETHDCNPGEICLEYESIDESFGRNCFKERDEIVHRKEYNPNSCHPTQHGKHNRCTCNTALCNKHLKAPEKFVTGREHYKEVMSGKKD